MKAIRPADALIVALLLLIAAAAYFIPRAGSAGNVVVVTVSGEEYTRTDLADVADKVSFSVEGVEIEITPGGARVTDSDCPDKTCVRTGQISYPGEAAACVPNGVVVYIGGKAGDVDGIAY